MHEQYWLHSYGSSWTRIFHMWHIRVRPKMHITLPQIIGLFMCITTERRTKVFFFYLSLLIHDSNAICRNKKLHSLLLDSTNLKRNPSSGNYNDSFIVLPNQGGWCDLELERAIHKVIQQNKTSFKLQKYLPGIKNKRSRKPTSFILRKASAQTWVPLDSVTSMDPTY